MDLALEMLHRPALFGGLDLVKASRDKVSHLAQDEVVRPTKTTREPGWLGHQRDVEFGR